MLTSFCPHGFCILSRNFHKAKRNLGIIFFYYFAVSFDVEKNSLELHFFVLIVFVVNFFQKLNKTVIFMNGKFNIIEIQSIIVISFLVALIKL